MNKKYSIAFIIVSLTAFLLISGAYQFSYNAALERAQEELLAVQTEQLEKEASIETEGEALKNDCYYLMESNGFVVVYLSDKSTVYEYTSIEVAELPVTLQNEVKNGKYIETMEEVYSFLENYSS